MAGWRLTHYGDSAVLVELGGELDRGVNDRVLTLADALGAAKLPGLLEVVPASTSLLVHVDPSEIDVAALAAVVERAGQVSATRAGRHHDVPVCYDEACAPDLARVAEAAGLSVEDVVSLHTGREYRVFMIGFAPGFPYMGVVDPRLQLPRRSSPRTVVPAGSVAIAGEQTGIYPGASPGGWHIIGRTAVRLFDPGRARPATLAAGDTVRFLRISVAELERTAVVQPPDGPA